MDSWLFRTFQWALLGTLVVTTPILANFLCWPGTSKKEDEEELSKVVTITTEVTPAIPNMLVRTGTKPEKLWNTAIFFPCYFPDEDKDGSFARLLYYISSAERSLKVCVMTISYRTLMKAICKRHDAGVRVQVFTSWSCAHDRKKGGSGTGMFFRSRGIPVRSMKKTSYSTVMHHKYVIVDDEAILTGSMNWTRTSVTQQRENILITTDKRIVPKFVQNFDQLWNNNDWKDEELVSI